MPLKMLFRNDAWIGYDDDTIFKLLKIKWRNWTDKNWRSDHPFWVMRNFR